MTKMTFENGGSTIECLKSTYVARGKRSKIKPIDCTCDNNIREELITMIVIDDIKESIQKWKGNEYKHYFIVDRPEWDNQCIYNEINYTVESDIMDGGYIEVASMVRDEDMPNLIKLLKEKFNLPIYTWKRVMVDYE